MNNRADIIFLKTILAHLLTDDSDEEKVIKVLSSCSYVLEGKYRNPKAVEIAAGINKELVVALGQGLCNAVENHGKRAALEILESTIKTQINVSTGQSFEEIEHDSKYAIAFTDLVLNGIHIDNTKEENK